MSTPCPAQQVPAISDVTPVRSFKPEVLVLRCAVQQQLRAQFDYLLGNYNSGCLALGRSVGYQAAEEQMCDLFESCVKARDMLQCHETGHRCGESSTSRMLKDKPQALKF